MNGRRWLTAWSLALLAAIAGSGCASAPPIGTRPAAFPGAPEPFWGRRPDTGFDLAMRSVVDTAMALRGVHYQLGGATPEGGFDCSGFVRYVFSQSQLDVPRTVAEQFRSGRPVARTHVSSGDLMFFSTTGPGATHVGIVVDPVARTFVHAPGTGSAVRLERFDTPYWRGRLLGTRRVLLASQTGS